MDTTYFVYELEKKFRIFLGFYYNFFGTFPSIEADVLEAIVATCARQSTQENITWTQGNRSVWDIKIGNATAQIKGGKIEGKKNKKIRLSSFRLGKFIGDSFDPTLLKNGIIENITKIDFWFFFASELLENDTLRLRLYKCGKDSFIYDTELYNFSYIKKKTAWTYSCVKDNVEAQITPRLSHQLWYNIDFDNFNGLNGVKLLAQWDFTGKDLPKPILTDETVEEHVEEILVDW